MRRRVLLALAAVVAVQPVGARPVEEHAPDWRRIATLPDRDRLRRLRDAWVEGIRLAYAKGAGPAVKAEGALLDPDTALADPMPPDGGYRCRVFKLGGVPGFIVQPPIACRVTGTGGVLAFSMPGKVQRTSGRIFADTDIRGIFLGALALPEEAHVLPYGRDDNRNRPGIVRRVGPRQWRIDLPYPRFESTIDVIELVPEP